VIGQGYRPCGACRLPVAEWEGCEHWMPRAAVLARSAARAVDRKREARRRQQAALDRIRLMRAMALGLRG